MTTEASSRWSAVSNQRKLMGRDLFMKHPSRITDLHGIGRGLFFMLLAVAFLSSARADTRTSADYQIYSDVVDSAGGIGTSTDYTMLGSLGAIGSAIVGTSLDATLWNGYIGQLVELTATPCAPAPSGLVAWWPAEGNAADFTGNHSGTIASTPLSVPGQVGQSFFLDGGTNYVDIPYSPALFSLVQGTLEMWVRIPDLTTDTIRLFSVAKAGVAPFAPGSYDWEVDYRGDGGVIQLVVFNNGNITTSVVASNSILDTNFHHVAVVADGVGMNEVYVDGVLKLLWVPPFAQSGNDAFFAAALGADNMKIGAVLRDTLGSSGLVAIDEVSLYNRALSASEIQAIYAAGTYGKCNGDADGDSMPDGWEIAHVLNPNNPADAALDSDGDGMTNIQEYLAGTDPQNPADALHLENPMLVPAGQFTFELPAKGNKTYSVIYKNAVTDPVWAKSHDLAARPTNYTAIFGNAVSPGSNRFFKVVTPALP